MGNPWHPNNVRNCIWWHQGGFSCYWVEFFPSLKEETRLPPSKGFSQIWTWFVLEATMDTTIMQVHQCLPHLESSTSDWNWTMVDIPISGDNRLFHFCSYNTVKNEARFVLEYPLYNYIREKFWLLFENVVLGSFKSFFLIGPSSWHLPCLTEATKLWLSRELAGFEPTRCTLNPT